MQKLGMKFIKFGPIYLGPVCGPIHIVLKFWPKKFSLLKLS